MKWEQEEAYRTFLSQIKILEFRANDKARECNDEDAKEKAKQYKEVREKLNKISERRHYALIGENNEEKTLYEKILKLSYEKYKNTSSLDYKNFGQQSDILYQEISKLIRDYEIEREKESKNEKKEEIER